MCKNKHTDLSKKVRRMGGGGDGDKKAGVGMALGLILCKDPAIFKLFFKQSYIYINIYYLYNTIYIMLFCK